uniref:Macaca fascicularis brain cDNA clone: QmoA-10119, similar to human tetratricopeptide repeat domain 17 (TTC17), mRNA, RefSeq: NM_018259.3 n=1 Tax=Macaca fascicularis TaxID=9541 RepID=I7GKH7_MACFA|nr:unnamed protein product [Macaca fascicularis]
MKKPWTTHSHWMLLKKSPLREEQRRTLCSLLRIQGGTQMPLDLKVRWLRRAMALTRWRTQMKPKCQKKYWLWWMNFSRHGLWKALGVHWR